MVTIRDNAHFNRNALLNGYLDLIEQQPALSGADQLKLPSENYGKAASLVWLAMKSTVIRQQGESMLGGNADDGDRPGFLLTGMTPTDVVRLLWPTLSKDLERPSIAGIMKVFRETGNALVLINGHGTKPSTYWISEEWKPSQVAHTEKLTKAVIGPKPMPKPPVAKVNLPIVTVDDMKAELENKVALPEVVTFTMSPGTYESADNEISLSNAMKAISKHVNGLKDENRRLKNENKMLNNKLNALDAILNGGK